MDEMPKLSKGLIAALKDQLLMCFVRRQGGEVRMPVAEVDSTGSWVMHIELEPETKCFVMRLERKC